MFDGFYVIVSDVAYFHPILVFCLCLISSWIPGIIRRFYCLLYPLVSLLVRRLRR